MKVDYSRFSWGGLHGKHVVATWIGKTGTIPAFAVGRATCEARVSNVIMEKLTFWHRNLEFKF
jgi:hypothetical protein